MDSLILGASGFIATNLIDKLKKNTSDNLTLFDKIKSDYIEKNEKKYKNLFFIKGSFDESLDFEKLTQGQDIVYHFISTTVPTTSNCNIAKEVQDNVIVTIKLLDACVNNGVKKVVFLSSGGTVYGVVNKVPIKENQETNPIVSYGVQKLTIEKLLYLYYHIYGIDYKIIRLANPYGPYQSTEGVQGVVTSFIKKVICNENITIFGDGTVIRDYIYIDDAIQGIINISNYDGTEKIFNLGSGIGTSINQLVQIIQNEVGKEILIKHFPARQADVPVNILNMEKYKKLFGDNSFISLQDGVNKTRLFLSNLI